MFGSIKSYRPYEQIGCEMRAREELDCSPNLAADFIRMRLSARAIGRSIPGEFKDAAEASAGVAKLVATEMNAVAEGKVRLDGRQKADRADLESAVRLAILATPLPIINLGTVIN
jgi:hypothetical protein